jgi:tetratricopeptide (TPR) repeat protein
MANKQYQLKNYDFALKEYQRYLFFDQSPNAGLFYVVGECYWNLNDYNQAAEFYDKAFFTSGSDSLHYKSLFRKVDCYIHTGDFGLALGDLLSLNDSLQGNNYYMNQFYCGLCYYGMQDFANAEISFINSIDPAHHEQREEIKRIFANKKSFYRPNSNTAMFMSMFIPGTGQLYSGDIKNAANSLLLTAFLGYLGVRIAVTESIFDAIITIIPWLQRYYQGGYTHAEQDAIQKRVERRSKIFKKIAATIASSK